MTTTLRVRSLRALLFRVLPATLVVAAGCARPPAPMAGETRTAPAPRASSANITQEEIRTAGAAHAYDLVQSLRPRWLIKRGDMSHTPTAGDIVVYLGTARMGGLNALREVSASGLVSIEFLEPAQANYRFGRGHQYGAIILKTVTQ